MKDLIENFTYPENTCAYKNYFSENIKNAYKKIREFRAQNDLEFKINTTLLILNLQKYDFGRLISKIKSTPLNAKQLKYIEELEETFITIEQIYVLNIADVIETWEIYYKEMREIRRIFYKKDKKRFSKIRNLLSFFSRRKKA